MRFYLFLIFGSLFNSQSIYGQMLQGIIVDENNISIANASITVWDSNKKENLIYYNYSDEKGRFFFYCNVDDKNLFIEVKALRFQAYSETIFTSHSKLNIVLQKSEIVLEEVQIKIKKAIKVANDTVFYDPKKFLDGTERKVEDLLSKLPGISVNRNTGEIKYKGKSVEAVNLEGDDLFGGSYSIGTKNISVDMLEEVQAIENYSTNKLLTGITSSDKVALNLKLKKNKTNFSGTSSLKNGYSDQVIYANDITLLGISKTLKSFGVSSFNNSGSDAEKIMSFSDDKIGYRHNEILLAKQLLEVPSGSINLPDTRTKFNSTLFGNSNLIYKINSKLTIKNNFYLIHDKLNLKDATDSHFFLNNENTLVTSLANSYLKNLNYYRIDTKITYDINDKSQLLLDLFVKSKLNKISLQTFQNENINYQTQFETNDFFINGNLEYTYLLPLKKALQLYSTFSKNDIPQNFMTTPYNSSFTGFVGSNGIQSSLYKKTSFLNKGVFLSNYKGINSQFSAGNLITQNPFTSALMEDGINNSDFSNALAYLKSKLFLESDFTIKFRKFNFNLYVSVNHFHQKLTNNLLNEIENKNDLSINFKTIVEYDFNRHSKLYFKSVLNNRPSSEHYLFNNKVLTNDINIESNKPSLELIKAENFDFGYKYVDLLNSVMFDLNFSYLSNSNSFIPNIALNQNYSLITYFQVPNQNKSRNYSIVFEKQFKKTRTSIKHISSFSQRSYNNAIEDFRIRNNNSLNYNGEVFVSTFFDFPINFDNKISYSWYSFNNNSVSERVAVNNTFKLNIKATQEIIFSLTNDYFVSSVKNKDSFSFIDFSLQFKSEKLKWLNFNIYGRNLLNISTFKQTETNDFSFIIYETKLIPRHFLMAFEVRF